MAGCSALLMADCVTSFGGVELETGAWGVDYAYSVDEVKDLVCDGNKNALADANEEGCPLSGGNTTGKGNAN